MVLVLRQPLICRHDHQCVGVDVGVEVDRECLQREDAEDDHSDETQCRHDWPFDGATV